MSARYPSPIKESLIKAATDYDSVVTLLGEIDTSKHGFEKNIEQSLAVASRALSAEEGAIEAIERAISNMRP